MAAIDIGVGANLGENGRYRLERLLGTGGMASVWLASDARLQREVAIKVLSDVLALDQDYVARFEREARLAARLSHPHLVGIYDFSVHGTRPYLVLEYVAGGTLAERLRTPQTQHWDPLVLAGELLDAIGYIHGAGIIHRDIKPANVLIGTDGRARLADFGIAQPSEATRITHTGQVIGTQRYIAPEVLAGGQADQRSDLYACGVLLSECMRRDTPGQLQRLVDVLTAEDPGRRPESAAAALAALHDRATAPTMRSTPLRPRPAGRRLRTNAPRPGRRLRTTNAPRPERPVITRRGRAVEIHVTRATAAMIAAGAVLLLALILIISSGGATSTHSTSATSLTTPPASTPLNQQLDQLDQAISQSRR